MIKETDIEGMNSTSIMGTNETILIRINQRDEQEAIIVTKKYHDCDDVETVLITPVVQGKCMKIKIIVYTE